MGVTRMGKTTIFLADDDEGVRRTLRTFFEGLPGYRVVGEACDGMEAVEGISLPHTPDILVGFNERFCSFAILIETGTNSGI